MIDVFIIESPHYIYTQDWESPDYNYCIWNEFKNPTYLFIFEKNEKKKNQSIICPSNQQVFVFPWLFSIITVAHKTLFNLIVTIFYRCCQLEYWSIIFYLNWALHFMGQAKSMTELDP